MLLGLYVWLALDPKLIYFALGVLLRFPVFHADWPFLREHLARPGGPVEYLASLLTQGMHYSWLGAAIRALIAWAAWLATRMLIRLEGERQAAFLGYVPVLLLVALYSRYGHYTPVIVAHVTCLWPAVLYAKADVQHGLLRWALFLAGWALSYYLAAGASWTFTVLVALHECLGRGRVFRAATYLALGLIAPWALGTYVLGLAPGSHLHLSGIPRGTPSPAQNVALCFCASPALVLIAAGLWRRLFRRKASHGEQQAGASHPRHGTLSLAAGAATLVLLAVVSAFLSFHAEGRKGCRAAYLYRQGMWPQLLQLAREHPHDLRAGFAIHDINRALYHTGRLGEEMFSFPQAPDGLLHPESNDFSGWHYFRRCDTRRALGDVNRAERRAFELLENMGETACILEKLAIISVAKGHPETAGILLGAMSKDLIHGKRGQELLCRLDNDPGLSGHEEVTRLRAAMPHVDDDGKSPAEPLLLTLLQKNPLNRMAFEYLMAHYLLNRNPGKVAVNIGRLSALGYDRVPRHYEEAVLLWTRFATRPDLREKHVSTAAIQRFDEFARVCERFQYDAREAERRLAPEFGRTYYFYHFFGKSGVWK